MNVPIDIVVTWVDGNDQKLAAQRRKFAQSGELKHDDVGGVTRYASIGEIKWCLASVNRFAPWIHKIYIVTDNQDPNVIPFLEENFPEGFIPVEIVDHKDIFKGYEQFLPTFNSLSIETMLWRIPGLSRHFIEMNDDVMFGAPVCPEDFFGEEGSSVCYATWGCLPLTRLTRLIKRHSDGKPRPTTKGFVTEAAKIAGNRWTYLRLSHTPKALVRDAFKECLALHPQGIERNIRHRFRDVEQFDSEELHFLYLANRKRLCVKSPNDVMFYLQPKKKAGYVHKKLARLRKGNYKFCCFNNLNLATEQELNDIKAWIAETLNISI